MSRLVSVLVPVAIDRPYKVIGVGLDLLLITVLVSKPFRDLIRSGSIPALYSTGLIAAALLFPITWIVISLLVGKLILLLILPVLLMVAAAVAISSPGPIFFRQRRIGLNGSSFTLLKFRTMYQEQSDTNGEQLTRRNDPRITRIGSFLRRTSLDELPQLINVLRGDMSLVGPRPLPLQMRVDDRLNYEIVAEYAFRHRVKPGITGLAQVKGHRGPVGSADALKSRIACDLYYIDHWSLWLDLKILAMTSAVCVLGKNAF